MAKNKVAGGFADSQSNANLMPWKNMETDAIDKMAAKYTGTGPKKSSGTVNRSTGPGVEYKAGTEGPKSTSPTKKAEYQKPGPIAGSYDARADRRTENRGSKVNRDFAISTGRDPDVPLKSGAASTMGDDPKFSNPKKKTGESFESKFERNNPELLVDPRAAKTQSPDDPGYADYWIGKMYNRPTDPNFNTNLPTMYRDQFGEMSIPDSNDAQPDQWSWDESGPHPVNRTPTDQRGSLRDRGGAAPTQPEGVVPIGPATGNEFGQQFQSGTVPAAAQGQLPPQIMQLIAMAQSGMTPPAQGKPIPQPFERRLNTQNPYPQEFYGPGYVKPGMDHPDFFSPTEQRRGAPAGVDESEPVIALINQLRALTG